MSKKFHVRRHHRASARKRGLKLHGGLGAAACGMLVVAFFVGYLVQVNATSSKGFQIRTLESQISDLKEAGDKMELKVAQEQSVQAVEEKVKGMGMVPTPEVQYVTAGSPVVAQR